MKENNKSIFVVSSSINLSTEDTETVFAVVGVADNMERAKEILKEEVENEFYGADEPLSVDNKDHFPNPVRYKMIDTHLGVFCEVKITERVLNK